MINKYSLTSKKTEIEPETKKIEPTKTEASEPKKSLVEKVKEFVTTAESTLTLEKVNNNWSGFIANVEKKFPTLSFILKMAQIANVEGGILRLSVQYSFHHDKLMEKTIRRNLEEILSELLQTKVRLEVMVEEQKQVDNTELQELASSIGGEVLN